MGTCCNIKNLTQRSTHCCANTARPETLCSRNTAQTLQNLPSPPGLHHDPRLHERRRRRPGEPGPAVEIPRRRRGFTVRYRDAHSAPVTPRGVIFSRPGRDLGVMLADVLFSFYILHKQVRVPVLGGYPRSAIRKQLYHTCQSLDLPEDNNRLIL